jgi:hypothetical protein
MGLQPKIRSRSIASVTSCCGCGSLGGCGCCCGALGGHDDEPAAEDVGADPSRLASSRCLSSSRPDLRLNLCLIYE